MARRTIIALTLAAVAALPAAGCSGSDDDKKETQGVAWAGKVCDAVGRGSAQLQLPVFNDPKNAKDVKAGYLKFLEDLSIQLQTLETNLRRAGMPPVDGGQATWTTALRNLGTAKDALKDVTNDVRRADTSNIKAFEKSVSRLGEVMAKYSAYEGPVKDMRANKTMSAAFDKAPSCVSRKL